MKIKLAILDLDKNFLSRLSMVFTNKYNEKIETYLFTDKEVALASLQAERIDVLLASDFFEIAAEEIPNRCAFAYFVENGEVESIRGQQAIAKFQKAELLYKQILGLYAEQASVITGFKINDEAASQLIAFTSVSGGVGSSTMAAAFAYYLARMGKKVLYLNFEKFGTTENFFSGEGQFDFSDVLYAMISKKNNLTLKLESTVKQDASGVFFYETPKMALDLMELNSENMQELLEKLRLESAYDYIVMDMDFSLDKNEKVVWGLSNKIVFVNDGSEVANMKLIRAYASLKVMEEQSEDQLLRKAVLLYNKFSNKICQKVEGLEMKEIGGAPKFEHATTKQIMEQLATMQIFQELL